MSHRQDRATANNFRDKAIVEAGRFVGGHSDDELGEAMEAMRALIHETQLQLALTGLALAVRQDNDAHASYWFSSLQTNRTARDWMCGMSPDCPEYLIEGLKAKNL